LADTVALFALKRTPQQATGNALAIAVQKGRTGWMGSETAIIDERNIFKRVGGWTHWSPVFFAKASNFDRPIVTQLDFIFYK
jgi:hypothetical protein